MAELDIEVVERVGRWCAEAGRQAGPAEIRRAFAPLTWDELVVAKALLADPPPARPLGPHALADVARGVPPDLAAEREREGRYRSEGEQAPEVVPAAAAAVAAAPQGAKAGRGRRKAKGAGMVIRRARDRAAVEPQRTPTLPLLEELHLPEGRTVLERLVRRRGARRSALAQALAAGWRRPGGGAPDEGDVAALLEHHGLAHAFEHRERDELLHAVRAAGGAFAVAAAKLGVERGALESALARLGATAEAERIRERRRRDLRSRGTLSQRVRLLLTDEARLLDLGLLAELEDDLRHRLPEHVRALRTGREPVARALARSLSLDAAQASALAARFGLELVGARAAERPERAAGASRPRRPAPERASGRTRPRGDGPPRRPPAGGGAGARPSGERRPPAKRGAMRSSPRGGRRPGAPGPRRGGGGRG